MAPDSEEAFRICSSRERAQRGFKKIAKVSFPEPRKYVISNQVLPPYIYIVLIVLVIKFFGSRKDGSVGKGACYCA